VEGLAGFKKLVGEFTDMTYNMNYLNQLSPEERLKLSELLAMQQDNSEPGIPYGTGNQQFLSALADPQNSIRTSGFDENFMSGNQQPAPLPQNFIRNERTGVVTDLGQSQPSQPALDYTMPIEMAGIGKGYRLNGDATRAVMADGRIVDLGRDTARERAIEKENLALQKQRAELAQLQAKPEQQLSPQQKLANEIAAATERSKYPFTVEGARIAEQKAAEAKAKAGEEGKALPISAARGLMENQQNLRRAEEALALLSGKNVGKAVGDKEATGWKGYAPDALLQRLDPAGIDTRAAIADLGSLVIHDRSGAAVTAMEFPRLRPFIPSDKDDPATARKKLNRFVMEYRNIVDEAAGFYKESGYKVPTEKLRQADIKRPINDGVPPMETWVAKAKELNHDMSIAEIQAEYMKKYRR
jgi:hypothetical protein